MNIYEVKTPAELLSGNPYPGRGIVLGRMFFQEQVTPRQIAAAAIIIAGAVLYVRSDAEVADDNR